MIRALLQLLILAPLLASQDPTTKPTEPTQAEAICRTCDGSGEAELLCDWCFGERRAPCRDCCETPWRKSQVARANLIRQALDPEKARFFEGLRLDDAYWDNPLLRTTDTTYKTPGMVPCPGTCFAGRSVTGIGKCKLCRAKGRIKCKRCRGKGYSKCEVCAQRGKRVVLCPECIGSGRSTPLANEVVEPTACPWCHGRLLRDCSACEVDPPLETNCIKCLGTGRSTCETCWGTDRARCQKCGSTGLLGGGFLQSKSKKCDKCSGKGRRPCPLPDCKKGIRACASCDGKGTRIRKTCLFCIGYRKTPCPGCALGSELAWAVTADRLMEVERFEEANAHFDVAIERTMAKLDGLLGTFDGSAAERKLLRKPLDARIETLRSRQRQIPNESGSAKVGR